MARGYNYLFLENDSDDPKLSPEQKADLAKHVAIVDPLNDDKPVEGVISYDDHSGMLTKFRIFRGERLRGSDGLLIIDYLPRKHPTPKYKVVYLDPPPAEEPKPVKEAPQPVAEHVEG